MANLPLCLRYQLQLMPRLFCVYGHSVQRLISDNKECLCNFPVVIMIPGCVPEVSYLTSLLTSATSSIRTQRACAATASFQPPDGTIHSIYYSLSQHLCNHRTTIIRQSIHRARAQSFHIARDTNSHSVPQNIHRALATNAHSVPQSIHRALASNAHSVQQSIHRALATNAHSVQQSIHRALATNTHSVQQSIHRALATNAHTEHSQPTLVLEYNRCEVVKGQHAMQEI